MTEQHLYHLLSHSLPQRSPYPTRKKMRLTEVTTPQTELEQSLFICVRGKRNMTEAIRIPCHRPSLRIRRRCKRIEQDGLRTREVTWSSHTRGYYESDSKITEKMVIACYNYHGNWKRHIPFYGIIDVREVQVSLLLSANNVHMIDQGPFRFHLHNRRPR